MDEILETADKEMNLGKQELDNIDSFEKTLAVAREENETKIKQTQAKLAEIDSQKTHKHKSKRVKNEEEELFDDGDEKSDELADETTEDEHPIKAVKQLSQVGHKKHHRHHQSHQIENEDAEEDLDMEESGRTALHQQKSKHKKHHNGSTWKERPIKSWHITSIGESESVTEAMDRQEELDEAEEHIHPHKKAKKVHNLHDKKHHVKQHKKKHQAAKHEKEVQQ